MIDRWTQEILDGPAPDEPESTCAECPMLVASGFHPMTKCCTYRPSLANFLVGGVLADGRPDLEWGRRTVLERLERAGEATPLGLEVGPAYRAGFEDDKAAIFGRDPSYRCPHYVEAGGRCGIWAYRNAVCSTWFCKHERGAVGSRAWQALRALLEEAIRDVAIWCAVELGLAEALVAEVPDRAWGDWSGREVEFFSECARLAGGLAWRDVRARGGRRLAGLERAAREAFEALRAPTIPSRLALGAFHAHDAGGGQVRVAGYSPYDPIEMPRDVLEAAAALDGGTVQQFRAMGLADETLRLLVDQEILVEADPRTGSGSR